MPSNTDYSKYSKKTKKTTKDKLLVSKGTKYTKRAK